MNRPRVSFYTLGCRVNQYETRRIMENLPESICIVPFGDDAEIAVINSCVVTSQAERETRKYISRAKNSVSKTVILTGCYVEIEQENSLDYEGILTVSGHKKDTIPNLIMDLLGVNGEPRGKGNVDSVARPPLLVQTGCDKKCAYCVIHIARGPSKSFSYEDIKSEMLEFFRLGHQEVVLTGINIGSWGLENKSGLNFTELLKKLVRDIPDGFRIRIGSIEPEYVSDELIMLMEDKRIAAHLHTPFQSLSDEILIQMGRPNNVRQYEILAEKLNRKNIWFGGDLITGFPGETELIHQKSMIALKKINPSYLHVFPYSPRQGTVASEMEGYNANTAKKRALEMRNIAGKLKEEHLVALLNQTLLVVCERSLPGGFYTGTSEFFNNVSFKSDSNPVSGKIYPVKITQVDGYVLRGYHVQK
ncbi:MAG: MiaB/RimO family radical SAM methylthiotransferase [Deltaproteobacteria bacterium]|nr:MiaB/RimO family radical SAM methylthiotransferase [Deltaproteobacteria bacterium]